MMRRSDGARVGANRVDRFGELSSSDVASVAQSPGGRSGGMGRPMRLCPEGQQRSPLLVPLAGNGTAPTEELPRALR